MIFQRFQPLSKFNFLACTTLPIFGKYYNRISIVIRRAHYVIAVRTMRGLALTFQSMQRLDSTSGRGRAQANESNIGHSTVLVLSLRD